MTINDITWLYLLTLLRTVTCLFTVVMGLTNSYLLLDQAPGQESIGLLVGLGPDVPPKTCVPEASANLKSWLVI